MGEVEEAGRDPEGGGAVRRIEGRPRSVEGRRVYWVWAAMIQRCVNPKNAGYKNYGAKGVAVCDRWRSFDAFLADMGMPSAGLSLERNDSGRGYQPDNCRWATRLEQNNNRPDWCRYNNIGGERLSLREAWRKHSDPSVTYHSFVKRVVSRGWPVARALSAPAREVRCA